MAGGMDIEWKNPFSLAIRLRGVCLWWWAWAAWKIKISRYSLWTALTVGLAKCLSAENPGRGGQLDEKIERLKTLRFWAPLFCVKSCLVFQNWDKSPALKCRMKHYAVHIYRTSQRAKHFYVAGVCEPYTNPPISVPSLFLAQESRR